MTMAGSDSRDRDLNLSVFALLLVWGLLVYSNTFPCSFHFDDTLYIIDNPAIRNVCDLGGIWRYFPTRCVTFFTFALNYYFGKLDVAGYHIVNLCIHIAAAFLVWRLSWLIFSTPVMKKGAGAGVRPFLPALSAGLIFLVHPVQTEAVTYICQRSAALAAFFYLLSLCLYAGKRYVFSWLACLAGMFTKETAVTLPLMIFLAEFYFFREGPVRWKKLLPFLALVPLVPCVFFLARPKTFVDMQAVMRSFDLPGQGFPTQLRVLLTYLRLLVLPFNQNLDYDYPEYRSLLQPGAFIGLAVTVFCVFAAVRLFRKHRLVSFGIAWFFTALLPEWGLVPLGDAIFEHRLYLALAGFGFVIAGGIYDLYARGPRRFAYRAITAVIIVFSILTFQRNKVWKDEFSLWNDCIRKSGQKGRPYNHRAGAYFDRGDLGQSIADYTREIEKDPVSFKAYGNRGLAYHLRGDFDLAIADYNTALEIRPDLAAGIYPNRGNAYFSKKDFSRSIADYTRTIEIAPGRAEAYYNRGFVYQAAGDLDRAFSDYTAAIKLNPRYSRPYNNRGLLYYRRGDFVHAREDYDKAIGIDPGLAETYYNRAAVYQNTGDFFRALSDCSRAIEINPGYGKAYLSRGNLYVGMGRFDLAIADYNTALEISPSSGETYSARAVAYYGQREYGRSWDDVRAARALGGPVNPAFLKKLSEESGREH